MHGTSFKTCGAAIVTLALGFSLLATPVMARGGGGGGGGFRVGGGGGGFHGGGGGFHGGRGFHGGGGGFRGGYDGGDGGYGEGYGYGYGGAAIGLGLLGAGIVGSQEPYYSGDLVEPQDGGIESPASCASRFKSYNAASGTYLGYDGLRHSCP